MVGTNAMQIWCRPAKRTAGNARPPLRPKTEPAAASQPTEESHMPLPAALVWAWLVGTISLSSWALCLCTSGHWYVYHDCPPSTLRMAPASCPAPATWACSSALRSRSFAVLAGPGGTCPGHSLHLPGQPVHANCGPGLVCPDSPSDFRLFK